MRRYPTPGHVFCRKKSQILSQLATPDAEYTDSSPKGSVDAGIRELIDEINQCDGLVTTSSCAGRISVYLDGKRSANVTGAEAAMPENGILATAGGKGGGTWLYVSHNPVADKETMLESLNLSGMHLGLAEKIYQTATPRLIRFKFEPMILHILTASHEHAQHVVRAGLGAGFRETGAVSLHHGKHGEVANPVVAIRSMGLGLESLVGMEDDDGGRRWIVSTDYLKLLLHVSNHRFAENEKRIARFREALKDSPAKERKGEWEDVKTRRERNRNEGLERKEELRSANQKVSEVAIGEVPP